MDERGAIISECTTYRYRLWRQWGPSQRRACFVMLNPSTADAVEDDPTIRRCIAFAKAWGMDRLDVVNLFALRATDPKELKRHRSPIGPDNDAHIMLASASAELVVAAWGAHGTLYGRGRDVTAILGARAHALALTGDGSPRHPLYLKGNLLPFALTRV